MKGILGSAGIYRGIQVFAAPGYTRVYRSLQEFTGAHRGYYTSQSIHG